MLAISLGYCLGVTPARAATPDGEERIEDRPVGLASGRFAAAPWQIGALGLSSLVIAGLAWRALRRRPGAHRSGTGRS